MEIKNKMPHNIISSYIYCDCLKFKRNSKNKFRTNSVIPLKHDEKQNSVWQSDNKTDAGREMSKKKPLEVSGVEI